MQLFLKSPSSSLYLVVSIPYLFLSIPIYEINDFCSLQLLIMFSFLSKNGLLGNGEDSGSHNLI